MVNAQEESNEQTQKDKKTDFTPEYRAPIGEDLKDKTEKEIKELKEKAHKSSKDISTAGSVFSYLVLISSIGMIPTILGACFNKIDGTIALIAYAVYIALEIAVLATYKSSATAEFQYYRKIEKDKQKEAVSKAIELTNGQITSATIRVAGQAIFSAAMLAAGGVSIASALGKIIISGKFGGPAGALACAPVAGACPVAATCAGDTGAHYTPLKSLFNQKLVQIRDPTERFSKDEILYLSSKVSGKESDHYSSLLIQEYAREKNGLLNSISIDEIDSSDTFSKFNKFNLSAHLKNISNILKPLQDFLIPDLFAVDFKSADNQTPGGLAKEIGPKIGITGLALAGLIYLTVKFAKTSVPITINGYKRAAFYFGISTVGITAMGLTAKTLTDLQNDKEGYEQLLKKIKDHKEETPKPVSTNNIKQFINNSNIPNFPPNHSVTKNMRDTLCGTKKNSAFSKGDVCKCKGSKCKATTPDQSLKFPTNLLGSPQQTGIKEIATGLDSVLNGNLKGAVAVARDTNHKLATIKNANKTLKNTNNKIMEKIGLPPRNFNDLEKGSLDDIKTNMAQAWNELPSDQKKALSDYASGSSPPSPVETASPSLAEDGNQDKENEKQQAGDQVVVAPSSRKPSRAGKGGPPKGIGKKFDFLSGLDKNKGIFNDSAKARKEMKKYKFKPIKGPKGKQLVKKKGADIFKIITLRYFRSAYPRFFPQTK